jgi:hypothetical protein
MELILVLSCLLIFFVLFVLSPVLVEDGVLRGETIG